jgi:SAM-dependent methyltransferase
VSLAESWEQHAAEWVAWARTSEHDGFWDGTWPALRRLLPAPVGWAVLDLGCGEGRAGRELLNLGYPLAVGAVRVVRPGAIAVGCSLSDRESPGATPLTARDGHDPNSWLRLQPPEAPTCAAG